MKTFCERVTLKIGEALKVHLGFDMLTLVNNMFDNNILKHEAVI